MPEGAIAYIINGNSSSDIRKASRGHHIVDKWYNLCESASLGGQGLTIGPSVGGHSRGKE